MSNRLLSFLNLVPQASSQGRRTDIRDPAEIITESRILSGSTTRKLGEGLMWTATLIIA